jgi:hypothetical protein
MLDHRPVPGIAMRGHIVGTSSSILSPGQENVERRVELARSDRAMRDDSKNNERGRCPPS